MPFQLQSPIPRRIAIIGGGISGMAAAHLLAKDHKIVLFEAENRLGGHARTVIAGKNGNQPVDTGFIVFNQVNYPNLVALFNTLNVPTVKSNMSFGASIGGGRFEYGFRDWSGLVAQKRNVANPRYWGMLWRAMAQSPSAIFWPSWAQGRGFAITICCPCLGPFGRHQPKGFWIFRPAR
jgi:predicted NAD/FAD-binding protein